MNPAFVDGPVTVYQGDVLPTLRELPDESVHCIVTSPPYWGLRDYGTATWDGGDPACSHTVERESRKFTNGRGEGNGDGYAGSNLRSWTTRDATPPKQCKCGARRIDTQLGLEPTPEGYVEHMVAVFRELRRVLRRDGTCWLNMGDGYAASSTYNTTNSLHTEAGWKQDGDHRPNVRAGNGLKPKDLIGMPWRLAFALQADGWWLRSDIIWAKPNPMPESVTDRPTNAHEHIFLLTRSARYYYDAEAVREAGEGYGRGTAFRQPKYLNNNSHDNDAQKQGVAIASTFDGSGRNLRNVWDIATEPYPDAHFSTFPQAIPLRCIKAGSREGDTILDPFAGSGTTLAVARRLGRRPIGIELNPSYVDLIQRRVGKSALPLLEAIDNGQTEIPS